MSDAAAATATAAIADPDGLHRDASLADLPEDMTRGGGCCPTRHLWSGTMRVSPAMCKGMT